MIGVQANRFKDRALTGAWNKNFKGIERPRRESSLPATFKIAAILLALAGFGRPLSAETMTLALLPPEDNAPINFEAERSKVVDIGSGYMVYGEVSLVTPIGKIELLGCNLFFGFAPGTRRIQSLTGQAYVPSPFTSAEATAPSPVVATVGFDLGKNLDLGVPLAPNRTYLYFKFDAGLELQVGATNDRNDTKAFSIKVPVGISALEILDPKDPFYYIAGGLVTPASNRTGKPQGGPANGPQPADRKSTDENTIEKIGVGASIQGLIPFQPRTTYGIEDQAKPFSGNLILAGNIQVPDLPLAVDGYEVAGVVTEPESVRRSPLSA